MMKRQAIWLLGPFLAVLLTSVVAAYAHGGAEINAYPPSVAPGETLVVEGEDINANGPIAIFLDSVRGRLRLGQVQGDAEGNFKVNLTIPQGASTGRYLLKAVGSSGTTASVEVTITAASSQAPTTETRMATPEAMKINRARSTGEWIGLIVFLSGIAFVGTLLAWSRKR